MYEVSIDFDDGTNSLIVCEDWDEVRKLIDDHRDDPVRIWVDGDMVQRGFIADDED